jgi:hypothetical protein
VTESPVLIHALITSCALYLAKTGDGDGEGEGKVVAAPPDEDDAPHAETATITTADSAEIIRAEWARALTDSIVEITVCQSSS